MLRELQHAQRTVLAPWPTSVPGRVPCNGVLCVVLKADEDVEWTWTSTADGMSYVSGYTIVKLENGAQLA